MTDVSGTISVVGLGKTYPTKSGGNRVLDDLTFDVPRGQFLSIVGPSGAGKTTLLRCLTGLLKPTEGQVLIDGQPISGPNAKMSVVFQEYTRSLMPWLSVADNVELALQARGASKSERRASAREALSVVGLADAVDRFPWQLSGGMQQRVAIARAMVTRPEVLVMDEPFASIDAQTKMDLEDLIMNLQQTSKTTVLFVTHDIDESVYLADRVLVLTKNPCRVQADLPINLARPRDQVVTRSEETFLVARAEILGLIRASQSKAASPAS